MDSELTKFLYFKTMKRITLEHPAYTATQVVDATVQSLYEEFVPEQDRRLIKLAFQPNISQKDLDDFLKTWDIEAAGAHRSALLAYVMKMHPELKFDAYTGPRLKGLMTYLRFQNLELISHFSKIVRRLNQKNITPMIIKGGAMRYIRSDLPRVMGDIDILVHSENELNAAKNLVQEMGYIFEDAGHSFDVHLKDDVEKGILDIHQFFSFLPKLNEKINDELFYRAQKEKIFSVDALLPSREDMVFILLNNLTLNLKTSACLRGMPYTVFDLAYLIHSKEDFDWNIVIRDIRMTHTEATSYLAMRFINQIVPGIFPKAFAMNKKISRKIENFINHDKFYSLYVHDVKFACKKLKIGKAVCHWKDFKNYLRLEGQHFFTKRILKHPMLIRWFFKCYRPSHAS